MKGLKQFGAHLVPEQVKPGRAKKVPVRCVCASDKVCLDRGLRDDQLLLTLQPPVDTTPLPASTDEAAGDPLAFKGTCRLHVWFTVPASDSMEARLKEVDVARATWVGVDVNKQRLQEAYQQKLESWVKLADAQVCHGRDHRTPDCGSNLQLHGASWSAQLRRAARSSNPLGQPVTAHRAQRSEWQADWDRG